MSSSSHSLQFTLSSHGDAALCKMNKLRQEHRFCDVTLLLGSLNGSPEPPWRFHGHRVVLAASSDFLHGQFLLHEGQAELSVGVVSSVIIAESLLLSCYTGFLEVPLKDLLSYLTAASELQMSQVVNKCIQAISLYLTPSPFPLRTSSEKENQLPDSSWPRSILENQKEKDAVQPSIQEDNTKEQGAVLNQHELRDRKEFQVDYQRVRSYRVKANKELPEESDLLNFKSHPPKVFKEVISSKSSKSIRSVAHDELEENPQKQHEHAAEVCTLSAPEQDGGTFKSQSAARVSNCHLSAESEDLNNKAVQKAYLCRRCEKLFQHLWSYVAHLKEHRHFSCLICGEVFSQRRKLSRHFHDHTSVKPFRCPLCHKTFTQKALLQDHVRLHTDERLRMCVSS